MADKVRAGRQQVMTDVESELITGFIDSLVTHDLSGPVPQLRMCWAGWRAALLVRDPNAWEEVPEMFNPSSAHPPARTDTPTCSSAAPSASASSAPTTPS
jgi:hypothetical protein